MKHFSLMKHCLYLIIVFLVNLAGFSQTVAILSSADSADDFITTWEVTGDEAGRRIVFPGSGSYTIDWGDGHSEPATGNISHTYADAGTYRVTASNGITRFNLWLDGDTDSSTNRQKFKSVEQWGTAQWTNLAVAFREASNMTYNATDVPDLAKVTGLNGMFRSSSFSGDISNWDVSNVQAFQYMFETSPFNGDISNWNVSGAISMNNMFQDADNFMQNMGKWFISPSEIFVFDGAPSGSVVGTITPQATLSDDQVHAYTISGGADSDKFSITPDGVLTINEPPSHATKSSYDIEIKATGNLGKTLTNTRTVTIHVMLTIDVAITSSSGASGSTLSSDINTFSYTATFSEPVSGFDKGDITVSSDVIDGLIPVVSNFEAVPGGTTYTFDITADSEGTRHSTHKDYKLTWEDNFDGTELDYTKWYGRYFTGNPIHNLDEHTRSEFTVPDGEGHLVLTRKKIDGIEYSGAIGTNRKSRQFLYGFFESRMRWERKRYVRPAFWVQTVNPKDASEQVELDIMEYFDHRGGGTQVQHNVHVGNRADNNAFPFDGGTITVDGVGWNTFGCIWTKDQYRFFVNEEATWAVPTTREQIQRGLRTAHIPAEIIFSIESNVFGVPERIIELPQTVEVDWVRYYQKILNLDDGVVSVSIPALAVNRTGSSIPVNTASNTYELTTYNPDDFITTWTVPESDKSITFPGSGSYTLDWGDGTDTESATGNISHTYATAGTYRVTASNGITRFNLWLDGDTDSSTNRQKFKSVEQWGTAQWTNLAVAFREASNMTYNATDVPDLAKVTGLNGMFRSSSFSGDISNWDVSNVQAFQYMFAFSPFNGDISNWNVSGATTMKDMFQDADGFMQNLGKWFISQSELTVFDGAASGSEIGTITPQATLPDDEVHTYTISGGADMDKFSITPDGVLTINESPSHATKSSYDIEIKATGNLGKTLTNTKFVTINVILPITVTITSSSGATGTSSVSSNRLSYTATFSKPVTGFDITDITVSGTANGGNPNLSNFEAVPGGTTYTFDITADSEGTVSVRVGGDVATGDSGNGNSPSNIHELTSDTTPPDITLLGDPEVSIELGTPYTDEGATATDNIDGDLTDQITTVNPVDTDVAGIYTVTYDVSDAAGNEAGQISRTVTVTSDTTPPVITLLGEPAVSIELGTAYTDEGATATDNIDGILTDQITTVNPVDINTVGDYIITYNVSDAAGNRAGQVSRTVTVTSDTTPPDITPPVITLLGDPVVSIELGTAYTDEGATATDNIDGILTDQITTVNPVDTGVEDIYTVTYNVSDAAGNEAGQVSRMVTVTPDITPPVITLLGDPVVSIELGTPYTDEGATATDNIDGDLTNDIATVNPVDTDVAGIYIVTYNVSDAAGNRAEVTRTVSVTSDITPPVITLLGDPVVSIELGTAYTDEGATATDNIDGDLTDHITTVNPVDTDVAGIYTVTYNVSDAAGNRAGQVSRTVTVTPDITPPVITLLGEPAVSIELGTPYTDEGATATDNIDGDLTNDIATVNPVDTDVAGIYIVTYNVSDAAGNEAGQVSRTVTIAPDTTPPVITLLGEPVVSIELGTAYTDEGATATDNIDGDLTDQITTVNPVDTGVEDIYTVTYNVSDAAGNEAGQVSRTVTVTPDTTPPVITLLGDPVVSIELGTAYTDEGATATDNIDGILTNNITTVNPVDTDVADIYTVTYNVSDAAGNRAEVTRTVTVTPDITPPDITLLGEPVVSIELGTPYTDEGATATDNIDGDLTNHITTVNPVDTDVADIYTVTYNVSDAAGNRAGPVSRTVTVTPDITPPVITLLGDPVVSIELGTAYIDEGATATDNIDGDLTNNITTVNPVGTDVADIYTVTYNVSDAAGNEAGQVSRTVTILTPLSIEGIEGTGIYISPNPTSGMIYIGNIIENIDYVLIDAKGQILKNGTLTTGNDNSVDISHLVDGVYFLNIKTSEGNFTGRVVRKAKL